MGDEREGRRRSLMGAGPLLGQLHFLPSVEAGQTHAHANVGATGFITDTAVQRARLGSANAA